jgi:hypothetical protein
MLLVMWAGKILAFIQIFTTGVAGIAPACKFQKKKKLCEIFISFNFV